MKNLSKKHEIILPILPEIAVILYQSGQNAGKMEQISSYLILPELTCNSSYL